jgi:hypothetical protein
MSQLPEQVTAPQEVLPMQLSAHVVAVHVTLPHAMPEQLIVQLSPPQLTLPHAPPVGQSMVHAQPAGHITFTSAPGPIAHVIAFASQLAQIAGQPGSGPPSDEPPPPPNTQ